VELLERDTQLQALHVAFDRAGDGRGSVVLVSGEAGVGKTSLIRAFVRQVGDRAGIFIGASDDLVTPRTLGPFRDMGRHGGVLARVGPKDRDGFIDALLTEMSAPRRPTVVIVEDAHWADDASLDVVHYVARRIEALPAMLVVSYRDEELSRENRLHRLIGALTGPAVVRIELRELSDQTVARLATEAGLQPGPVVAAVCGNPFHLTEVLAAPDLPVPVSVRHAVLARLDQLPEACRAALGELAVIPTEVEDWLVAALLDDATVLDPAERLRMLVVRRGRVQFRHELARRVVERSIPRSCRAEHHRAVLAALAAARAEAPWLVHHAVGAGDDVAAARYAAVAAAEAAAADGHREAAAFAGLALERATLLDPGVVARCDGFAAWALYFLNRFQEAAEHADRAVA